MRDYLTLSDNELSSLLKDGDHYGGATPKDLETAMQMIYAYFTEPREDTAIFKGIIARSKAGLANRASDPNSVFSDTVSAVMGNHNSRRTGPALQKLAQIDPDKA